MGAKAEADNYGMILQGSRDEISFLLFPSLVYTYPTYYLTFPALKSRPGLLVPLFQAKLFLCFFIL